LIKYTPFRDHQPGLIFDLLMKSYESYLEMVQIEKESWKKFDSSIFSNMDTIGKCGFVSCLEDKPIGFASWDPRNHPELVIIGHNCVLPEYRNRGFGRLQVLEMMKRFKDMEFKKAKVWTGSTPFFLPAQKMYKSCGFKEIRKIPHEKIPNFDVIYYEKELL
jgi:ribosomal protein S18 acetylase RimI-like enzyme